MKQVEFDHAGFMRSEDDWPVWPFLPLKKQSGGWPVGLLVAGRGFTVYLKNMYDPKSLDDCEVMEYDSAEAAVADGWRVD